MLGARSASQMGRMGREQRGVPKEAPGRSEILDTASIYQEKQAGWADKPAVQQEQEDRQSLETRIGGQCWTPVLPGDAHLTQIGAATTHLAVLRDLHLFPLWHLGDVEVALWDPQGETTTRSIRRKSKPEDTRTAF